jgi:hypothetical protein
MPLKILLGKISSDWMAIIADLAHSGSGLEIVGVLESPLDVLLRTKELSADLVVLSQLRGGGEPGICTHFLLEYPNVELLLLPASPGESLLWRMVLRKQNYGEASRNALQAALQAALKTQNQSSTQPG